MVWLACLLVLSCLRCVSDGMEKKASQRHATTGHQHSACQTHHKHPIDTDAASPIHGRARVRKGSAMAVGGPRGRFGRAQSAVGHD